MTEAVAVPTGAALIRNFEPKIQRAFDVAAIPSGVDRKRLEKMAYTLLANHPELLPPKVTENSLLHSMIEAASLGLELGGPLGEAAILAFGDKATLIVQYRGLVKLARQSGEVVDVEARAVFKGDTFAFSYGLHPSLIHEPSLEPGADDANNLTHAYAIAWLHNGRSRFEVLSRQQIDFVRGRSRAYQRGTGPWADPSSYSEMARKTALKRLMKMLPLSAQASTAVAYDNQLELQGEASLEETGGGRRANGPPADAPSRTFALRERMQARAERRGEGGAGPQATRATGHDLASPRSAPSGPAEKEEKPKRGRPRKRQVAPELSGPLREGVMPNGPDQAQVGLREGAHMTPATGTDSEHERARRRYFAVLNEKFPNWSDDDRHAFQKGESTKDWSVADFAAATEELEAAHPDAKPAREDAQEPPPASAKRDILMGRFLERVYGQVKEEERVGFGEYLEVEGLIAKGAGFEALSDRSLQKFDDDQAFKSLLENFYRSPLSWSSA